MLQQLPTRDATPSICGVFIVTVQVGWVYVVCTTSSTIRSASSSSANNSISFSSSVNVSRRQIPLYHCPQNSPSRTLCHYSSLSDKRCHRFCNLKFSKNMSNHQLFAPMYEIHQRQLSMIEIITYGWPLSSSSIMITVTYPEGRSFSCRQW